MAQMDDDEFQEDSPDLGLIVAQIASLTEIQETLQPQYESCLNAQLLLKNFLTQQKELLQAAENDIRRQKISKTQGDELSSPQSTRMTNVIANSKLQEELIAIQAEQNLCVKRIEELRAAVQSLLREIKSIQEKQTKTEKAISESRAQIDTTRDQAAQMRERALQALETQTQRLQSMLIQQELLHQAATLPLDALAGGYSLPKLDQIVAKFGFGLSELKQLNMIQQRAALVIIMAHVPAVEALQQEALTQNLSVTLCMELVSNMNSEAPAFAQASLAENVILSTLRIHVCSWLAAISPSLSDDKFGELVNSMPQDGVGIMDVLQIIMSVVSCGGQRLPSYFQNFDDIKAFYFALKAALPGRFQLIAADPFFRLPFYYLVASGKQALLIQAILTSRLQMQLDGNITFNFSSWRDFVHILDESADVLSASIPELSEFFDLSNLEDLAGDVLASETQASVSWIKEQCDATQIKNELSQILTQMDQQRLQAKYLNEKVAEQKVALQAATESVNLAQSNLEKIKEQLNAQADILSTNEPCDVESVNSGARLIDQHYFGSVPPCKYRLQKLLRVLPCHSAPVLPKCAIARISLGPPGPASFVQCCLKNIQ